MDDNSAMKAALFGGALVASFYYWYQSRHLIPLPPGPRGIPLLGSALETKNAEAPWLKFAEYNNQYGPITAVPMLGERWIILSDPHLVSELFEKRAANYSDRVANELVKMVGWDDSIVFIQYGPLLKRYRTLLQRALNNRVALDYIPLQEYEARRFMRRLVEDPSGFMKHIHLMAASTAVRLTYGHKVESADDINVRRAEEIMHRFSEVMSPSNAWIIDRFPFLRYVPAWFPFAGFKRQIQYVKRIRDDQRSESFEHVVKQVGEGTAENSFVAKLLQPEDGQPVDEETRIHIRNLAGSLYGGASDTTVSAIQSFFLAMTLYPEIQAKAQAEIDAYIEQRLAGGESSRMILPVDRSKLPYTSALASEILRWHPVANMAGHRSSNEDDCNVVSKNNIYRIPARSLVLANIWQITHDPEVYDEPERFKPERYLVPTPPPLPEYYAFGFGRRICPGVHIAQQSMWISISNTLANFVIAKCKDEHGHEIVPEERYSTGAVSHPMPFQCTITPKNGLAQWLKEVE
ncbi:cytochrome P450 family protein [Ceratobasidium sp. AG-Ba]|nr:cytochrome P450 family protein [Ceratobasidium sp. AG-Ba]QRV91793.1 cytochrome P450 family protein [Ceratobasidium sp. AG-Ba]